MDSVNNCWGNNLIDLCIACNLCVLNGRTLGDSEGRFTFYGNGYSTIDLTLVDKDMFSNTLSFTVHDLTDFPTTVRSKLQFNALHLTQIIARPLLSTNIFGTQPVQKKYYQTLSTVEISKSSEMTF
jgi:hypothetical protein